MMVAGHVLMLVAMLAVMLWRRDHYGHPHPAQPAAHAAQTTPPGAPGPAPRQAGAPALAAADSLTAVL